jgi:hypothetical protein
MALVDRTRATHEPQNLQRTARALTTKRIVRPARPREEGERVARLTSRATLA